jgi:hypothetical protein
MPLDFKTDGTTLSDSVGYFAVSKPRCIFSHDVDAPRERSHHCCVAVSASAQLLSSFGSRFWIPCLASSSRSAAHVSLLSGALFNISSHVRYKFLPTR